MASGHAPGQVSPGAVANSYTYDAWGNTLTSTATTQAAPASISSVGNAVTSTPGNSRTYYSTQGIGDLMMLTVNVPTSGCYVPTGGNVANWTIVTQVPVPSDGARFSILYGVVNSVGSTNIRVAGAWDVTVQEVTAGPGVTWAVQSENAAQNQGNSFLFPALTPSGQQELYYGVAVDGTQGTLSGGGTPGFSYVASSLSGGQLIAEGTNLSGTVQPSGNDTGTSSEGVRRRPIRGDGARGVCHYPASLGRTVPGPDDRGVLHADAVVRPGHE